MYSVNQAIKPFNKVLKNLKKVRDYSLNRTKEVEQDVARLNAEHRHLDAECRRANELIKKLEDLLL